MDIQITQYMRPDGRQEVRTTPIRDDLADQYDKIRRCGANLTAEVLMTGEVSLCIADSKVEDDFDIRVVANGPAVTQAWESMIGGFCALAFETWKNDALNGD